MLLISEIIQIIASKALSASAAWKIRASTDPVAAIRIPVAVTIGVFAVETNEGTVELAGVSPPPAHPSHVKPAGWAMADRAVIPLVEGGVPILALFELVLFANMTVRNRHSSSFIMKWFEGVLYPVKVTFDSLYQPGGTRVHLCRVWRGARG
jgi:hypothetical protein